MRWMGLVHRNQTVNIRMKVCQDQSQITTLCYVECELSGRKMSGGMVESLAETYKSRSFCNAESLGLINKERINSQEQSLRQPEREIKKGRRNEK